jgi:trehalose-phosphatase
LEHLLTEWPRLARHFKRAKHILLLADYDGTLTPIVSRPDLAELSNETRHILGALAQKRRLTVGVVSGRALDELKGKVAIPGLLYAGNHGLEIEGPGIDLVDPVALKIRPILKGMHRTLVVALRGIEGVIIEDKGLSLSVHYRMVQDSDVEKVKNTFDQLVSTASELGDLRVAHGKKVLEVRPAVAWDKGQAINLLVREHTRRLRTKRILPIYLGDDLTDEDGFKAIRKYDNGISVFVGQADRHTEAQYFLGSPMEVAQFLDLILKTAHEVQE